MIFIQKSSRSKHPEVTQGCYRTSSLQQTTCSCNFQAVGVRRLVSFWWLFSTMQLVSTRNVFPVCDARWCLQRSRTNCSYGVAINPDMDGRWFNTESPFRILHFQFFSRKVSGKNQNIHRFCANFLPGYSTKWDTRLKADAATSGTETETWQWHPAACRFNWSQTIQPIKPLVFNFRFKISSSHQLVQHSTSRP